MILVGLDDLRISLYMWLLVEESAFFEFLTTYVVEVLNLIFQERIHHFLLKAK